MINLTIFGENSYIGNAFANQTNQTFNITKLNSRGEEWQTANLSETDCILFCAGIAHQKATEKLHFAVNYELAVAVAKKAKNAGVPHFIYISTAAVLETDRNLIPKTPYGKSKLQAENAIKKLQDDNFAVTIIRPPMVYGKDCKGNFTKLAKLAKFTPIFPSLNNQRTFIYIENLNIFIETTIKSKTKGTFFVQNSAPVSTAKMVRQIRKSYGKKTLLIPIFNSIIRLFLFMPIINKMFGDSVYEGQNPIYIHFVSFEESIRKSLGTIE